MSLEDGREDIPSLADRAASAELISGDLRDEIQRTYRFSSGHEYHIFDPVTLYTRPGGSTHRVVDSHGVVHCVAFPGPNGDTVVTWKTAKGVDPVKF